MRRARLRVAGIGCEGCAAPSKVLLLKARGVRAVHVAGSIVEVVYDDGVSLEELLEESGVKSYYSVTVVSDEPAGSEVRPVPPRCVQSPLLVAELLEVARELLNVLEALVGVDEHVVAVLQLPLSRSFSKTAVAALLLNPARIPPRRMR